MTGSLLKGLDVAKKLMDGLKAGVAEESARRGKPLSLALIQVGDASDSVLYAKAIRRIMESVGIQLNHAVFSPADGEAKITSEIKRLASGATGVMVLTPVPAPLVHQKLNAAIPPNKDVEGARGFNPIRGQGYEIHPPTALAILELVLASGITIEGKDAVIIGRSRTVGQPAAQLIMERNATVTVCHSKTRNLEFHVRQAEILIVAAGKAGLVPGEWIKPGAVVVDAGENVVNGKVTGDVDFETAKERAAFITPVPSGVGPLTTYMLVKNVINLSKNE